MGSDNLMKKISKFTVGNLKNIKDVMRQISINKKRIVFVVNKNKKVLGTLTDGDVRRYLLKKGKINDLASKAMNKNFIYVKDSEEAESVLKLLDQKYEFIPVLGPKGELKNIIDRENFNIQDKKKIIRSRSPARISLAGGGTDITKYFFDRGGAGISLTINKYCNVHLIKRDDKNIHISSNDYRKKILVRNINKIKYNGNLDIVKSCIKLLKPNFGFDIYIETDVKPGSGLGGSAAVSSAVIGAINYLQSRRLNKYEIAELAFRAERIELNILGGWQDQYSTVFGCCNLMEFKKSTNLIQTLSLPNNILDELERRFILCYTGSPHNGATIQRKNEKNLKLIQNGEKLKQLVDEIKTELLRGRLKNIGPLINEGWKIKKSLDKKNYNKKILDIEKKLLGKKLATGCRLLGTGGGGYMLFFIEPNNWFNFINKIKKLKLNYLHVKFDLEGLKVWEADL